jgi:hypothetical protein
VRHLGGWLLRVSRPPHKRARLKVEDLESRNLLSASYYSFDGYGNNTAHPTWGVAGGDLLRLSPVAYADGVSSPSLPDDPSARVLSDLLNSQADPSGATQDLNTIDANHLSDFGYAWGQFIDHDMDLTPTDPSKTLTIAADPGDPSRMGDQTFFRSLTDPAPGPATRRSRSTPSPPSWTCRRSTAPAPRWRTRCAPTSAAR